MLRNTVLCLGLAAGLGGGLEGAIAASLTSDAEISLVRGANSWGAPSLDFPMKVLSNQPFVVLAPVGLALASDPNDLSTPLLILGSESLAYLGTLLVKPLFNRQRPYQAYSGIRIPDGPEDTSSFPSSHAAISFAAATALSDWRPELAASSYTLAALISYSRLYNGLHYPSDLLGGALLGVAAAKLTRWGFDRLPISLGPSPIKGNLTLSVLEGWQVGFDAAF